MITDGEAQHTPGTLVAGRYRIHELVGAGGMGSVWRATDELLGREVAIKQVRLDLMPAGEVATSRERTMREARIAAALHHPNVVSIFDVVTEDGEPWLVLEYVPSRSLGSILSEYGALHPAHVASIGAQVASALTAAHAAGIVHRDVKPDNILIARRPGQSEALAWPGGTVKLTDFGVSHAAAAPELTSTGVLTGTPAYFAPETARGAGTDARSDVYSLGATLYAAVEGRPPFDTGGENVLALLARIAQGGAPAPRRAGPLTSLLQQLTADDPAARPTAEQARHAFQQIAGWPQQAPAVPPGAPTLVRPPAHPTQAAPGPGYALPPPYAFAPPTPSKRRSSRGGIALAALLVVAVIAAVAVIVVNLNAVPAGQPLAGPPTTNAPASSIAPVPNIESIGDPRTADPCSLVDVAVLNEFGPAAIDREHSEFSACRADVTATPGAEVIYTVDFLSPPEVTTAASGSEVDEVGELRVVRQPAVDDSCEHRILFPDKDVVGIRAQLLGTVTTDLCAIVDAGTDFALQTITTSGIGTRRPLADGNPLAAIEACTLLTPDELAAVPGGETALPQSEYGGWGCIWRPPASDHTARMDYYRRYPLGSGDGSGTVFAGRLGAYFYEPGRCTTEIVQREFTGDDGNAHIDAVRIFTFGPEDDQQLCDYANALAEAAASKLPAG